MITVSGLRPRLKLPYGPEGFQTAVGAWSFLSGASLLLTPNAYASFPTYYRALAASGIPENALGAVFLVHGLITGATLLMGSPRWFQAAVAMVGGGLWVLMGSVVVFGTLSQGVYSAGGMFSLACGVGSFVSVVQFARENGNGRK